MDEEELDHNVFLLHFDHLLFSLVILFIFNRYP